MRSLFALSLQHYYNPTDCFMSSIVSSELFGLSGIQYNLQDSPNRSNAFTGDAVNHSNDPARDTREILIIRSYYQKLFEKNIKVYLNVSPRERGEEEGREWLIKKRSGASASVESGSAAGSVGLSVGFIAVPEHGKQKSSPLPPSPRPPLSVP